MVAGEDAGGVEDLASAAPRPGEPATAPVPSRRRRGGGRPGLQRLTALLEQDLPRLRACAAALTADPAAADALLGRVLEDAAAAWPRYVRLPDPSTAVVEALVRCAVRAPASTAPPLPAAPEAPGAPQGPLRVLAALSGLPPQQRSLLVLRDLAGLPPERAAAVLGVPLARAAAEHRAAVAALGGALGEDLATPPPGDDDAGGTSAPGAPDDDVVVLDLTAPDGAA